MRYDFTCDHCGITETVTQSIKDTPPADRTCICGGVRARVWSPPETFVRDPQKRGSSHGVRLPGFNLAHSVGRSCARQEQLYTKWMNDKRAVDRKEKMARGTSTKKMKGGRFERIGSIPRELVVGEARLHGNASGPMLKEHGKEIMKKHGLYWGDD